MDYKTLELTSVPISGDITSVVSSILSLMVITIIILTLGWVMYSILIRQTATSERNISLSNQSFYRAMLGLGTGLLLIPIGYFLSQNLVSGNIVWRNITNTSIPNIVQNSTTTLPVATPSNTTTGGRTCSDPNVVISQLQTSNVCSAASCSKTCSFDSSLMSIIKDEASKASVNYQVISALICRESEGNKDAVGMFAQNGNRDCGLMQINKATCDAAIMDPRTNIQEGIKIYKRTLSAVSSYSYKGNFQKDMLAFAAYNCCGNGDNPNSASVSCNTATGFPFPIPKWACPIDPGNSSFNMCNVKNYACDVYACTQKY